jgi:hypothetical protein
MTSFKEQFYEQLLEIQAIPFGPIDGDIDVISECHLALSFRQGAAVHAQNQGIWETSIDWINRWGKEQVVTGPIMRVVYSEKELLIHTFLTSFRALRCLSQGEADTATTHKWDSE